MTQLRLAKLELFSTGTIFPAAQPKVRNLGGAILLVAIDDYCSRMEEVHECAKNFLFPRTPEWQDHYNWVVSLAVGVDAKWLRGALDKARAGWDRQRAGRTRPRKSSLMRRRTAYELTRSRSSDLVVVEPEGAAGRARDCGAAPEL